MSAGLTICPQNSFTPTMKPLLSCHWVEVAALATMVVLAIVAACALGKISVFASFAASKYLGISLITVSFMILMSEFVYKAIQIYQQSKKTESSVGNQQEKHPPPVEKLLVNAQAVDRNKRAKLTKSIKLEKEAINKGNDQRLADPSPRDIEDVLAQPESKTQDAIPLAKETDEFLEGGLDNPPLAEIGDKKPFFEEVAGFKYSTKRSAREKMARQLYFSVCEGQQEKKAKSQPVNVFAIDLPQDIFSLRRPKMHLESLDSDTAGAAVIDLKGEDTYVYENFLCRGETITVAAVFDGHGGDFTSKALRNQFATRIREEFARIDFDNEEVVANTLKRVCESLDEELADAQPTERKAGSTGTAILKIKKRVYVVNVGDSRTVLVRPDRAIQLTEDADPENERFSRKILKNGGQIYQVFGVTRVASCSLNVARDFGIPGVPGTPKIVHIDEGAVDNIGAQRAQIGFYPGNFLVLASDGLWDVCSTKDVYEAMQALLQAGKTPKEMAGYLAKAAWDANTNDDITVLIVRL